MRANVGGHFYPGCIDEKDFFTSDCEYGCDCWMGSCRSDGPDGVDPFGKCPNNPNPDNEPEKTPMEKVFEPLLKNGTTSDKPIVKCWLCGDSKRVIGKGDNSERDCPVCIGKQE